MPNYNIAASLIPVKLVHFQNVTSILILCILYTLYTISFCLIVQNTYIARLQT